MFGTIIGIILLISLMVAYIWFLISGIKKRNRKFYASFKTIKFKGVEYYYKVVYQRHIDSFDIKIFKTDFYSIPEYSDIDMKKNKNKSISELLELLEKQKKMNSTYLFNIPIEIESATYSKEEVLSLITDAYNLYQKTQLRLAEIKNGEII